MHLPFTLAQFFEVFERYNRAVWPAQIILFLLALIIVILLVRRRAQSGVIISAMLAGLWAWTGFAYHFLFFSRISPAAYLFALACLFAAAAFVWFGVMRRRVQFENKHGWRFWTGVLLLTYSLFIYPLLIWMDGKPYFASPTFGLPCPTTIFTIGVLAFAVTPLPRLLLVVPVLWSLIGGQAAFLLSVPQDFGLIVAGAIAVIFAWRNATRFSGSDVSPIDKATRRG